MPHTSRSRSRSPSKSAFRQVAPKTSLTQRTPVAPSAPSAPSPSVAPAQAPQTVVVEQQSSVWQSVKQGFGWGIGTSIARNMFGGGPTVSPIVPPAASSVAPVLPNTTQELVGQPAYNQCRKEGGDHEACEHYLH
jgi:hypothetical protein